MIWTSKFLELWVSRASISPNKNTTKNHQLQNETWKPLKHVNFLLDVNSFRRFPERTCRLRLPTRELNFFHHFQKSLGGGFFLNLSSLPPFFGDEMFGLNTNRSTEKNKLSKQGRVASYSSSNLRYHSLCKLTGGMKKERKSPCWPNKNRDDFYLNWFKHLYGEYGEDTFLIENPTIANMTCANKAIISKSNKYCCFSQNTETPGSCRIHMRQHASQETFSSAH